MLLLWFSEKRTDDRSRLVARSSHLNPFDLNNKAFYRPRLWIMVRPGGRRDVASQSLVVEIVERSLIRHWDTSWFLLMTYWKSKNRLWQIKKVCWRRQRSIYAASLEKMGNRCRCLPTPFQEYLRRQQMIDKSGQRQTAKDDNSVLIRTQKIVIARQFCVLHPRTKTNCSSFNRHNRPFPQIDYWHHRQKWRRRRVFAWLQVGLPKSRRIPGGSNFGTFSFGFRAAALVKCSPRGRGETKGAHCTVDVGYSNNLHGNRCSESKSSGCQFT